MRWLQLVVSPIALIYALVVYIRNFLYDIGLFKSSSFKTPTICVGNLSMGGTGKTPMVDFLLTHLKKDYKVAILSRGYKRKSKGFQLATGNSDAEILGDEPYQLFRKHPDVTVAVDADRGEGIRRLEQLDSFDLIVLDDAFQHRRVKPSFSILLTTYDKPYPKDFYFPVGSLRDTKNQSKRADIIVATKCPISIGKKEMYYYRTLLAPKPYQKLLFAYLKYDTAFTNGTTSLSFEDVKNKKCGLVTGIAKPEPLVNFLHSKNINFEHLRFKDHHFFSESDINNFSKFELIITTEKDFVRLKGKLKNMYYLKITHEFLDGGEDILLRGITEMVMPD